ASRYPSQLVAQPAVCRKAYLAGNTLLSAHWQGAPGGDPRGATRGGGASAADQPQYRSSSGALCRPALLSPAATSRRADSRISATLLPPENGAGGRLGQHRFVQLRSLEPALESRGEPRGYRRPADGAGGAKLRARLS